jgi:hypothetical protein
MNLKAAQWSEQEHKSSSFCINLKIKDAGRWKRLLLTLSPVFLCLNIWKDLNMSSVQLMALNVPGLMNSLPIPVDLGCSSWEGLHEQHGPLKSSDYLTKVQDDYQKAD